MVAVAVAVATVTVRVPQDDVDEYDEDWCTFEMHNVTL